MSITQSFNPILVWFYLQFGVAAIDSVATLSIPFWSDFIKATNANWQKTTNDFQSHFGLILSATVEYVEKITQSNAFQSHFGLILSNYIYSLKNDSGRSFNPILVWFYRSIAYPWSCLLTTFQSHFGLILSLSESFATPVSILLSIPFWSDFIIPNELAKAISNITFNPILVWFYPRRACCSHSRAGRFQSHFGLILSGKLKLGHKTSNFQSHFGLILSWLDLPDEVFVVLFQSHFGLILSGFREKSRC